MSRLWPLLALLACHGPAVTEGAAFYEQNEYDRSISTLESIDSPSATALYDLGNAWYRKGDPARAIAAWRAAQQLSPRNGDIVHNLALARSQIQGVPDPVPPPRAWMDVMTPGEIVTLAACILAFASFGAVRRGRIRPQTPSADEQVSLWLAPWLLLWLGGAALGAIGWSGARAAAAHPVAVVIEAEAPVRDEPTAEAKSVYTLPAGTEVSVERHQGPFLLVVDSDKRRGWLTEGAVALPR